MLLMYGKSVNFQIYFIIKLMSTSGFNTSFGVQPQNSLGNTLTSEKKSIPEYKKIFCAYHTTEFLTNFCVDSKR